MPRKISMDTALRRYQVQVIELKEIRKKCITGGGMNALYTDFVTCQGVHPGRLSGEGHKKCGKQVQISRAYKCLYCDYWFCRSCAEKHFGKTKEQHIEEMKTTGEYNGLL